MLVSLSLMRIVALCKTVSGVTVKAMNHNSLSPQRFPDVEGFDGRKNDIIYHRAETSQPSDIVIYFGGDVQDYSENMLSHRDNKMHVKWNLENTAILLHKKFPLSDILIIRPSRMHLKTFSCYENFVKGNDFGAPNHMVSIDALKHLKLLLHNFLSIKSHTSVVPQNSSSDMKVDENSTCELNSTGEINSELPISLVGFSKGCVVLNQLLYSFMALNDCQDEDLMEFVKRIHVVYWLDGGHSGSCDTWVTNKAILRNFLNMKIKIRIHVTPYQVFCETRPRIGKEEKIFRETLRRLQADIQRTLHFEDDYLSFENHFRVLEAFTVSE